MVRSVVQTSQRADLFLSIKRLLKQHTSRKAAFLDGFGVNIENVISLIDLQISVKLGGWYLAAAR